MGWDREKHCGDGMGKEKKFLCLGYGSDGDKICPHVALCVSLPSHQC